MKITRKEALGLFMVNKKVKSQSLLGDYKPTHYEHECQVEKLQTKHKLSSTIKVVNLQKCRYALQRVMWR